MNIAHENVTLFLIEDDDIDAISIERTLKKQNIRNPLVRAYDGLEAFELLKTGKVARPYVILLDLQLPRLNGHEFLKKIRQDPDLADSVVFILSTSNDAKDLAVAHQNHVAGYFVKDATGPLFIDAVKVLDGYWKIAHLPMQ